MRATIRHGIMERQQYNEQNRKYAIFKRETENYRLAKNQQFCIEVIQA